MKTKDTIMAEKNVAEKPLIIQSDKTLLLDVHNPNAQLCRSEIISFTELTKAPEHIHTFSITPISLWNANSAGISADIITQTLAKWSKYNVPESVLVFINETCSRFGELILAPYNENAFLLSCKKRTTFEVLQCIKSLRKYLTPLSEKSLNIVSISTVNTSAAVPDTNAVTDINAISENPYCFKIKKYERGSVKVELIKAGFPIDDKIPLNISEHIDINLTVKLRDYQIQAVHSFLGNNGLGVGYGTVVMPCGSGKTITGIAIICKLKTRTLVMCPNIVALHQWINELKNKTDVDMNLVGEYSGEKKEIKPITVCTYQVLTHRTHEQNSYPHMDAISKGNWGLVIYDEVHLLPAPVFRISAELQSIYRIGFTATLIREDGREDEVFSLVGPKRYDIPWTKLEQEGWIAKANCIEIKIKQNKEQLLEYYSAGKREKYRIASNNFGKIEIVKNLLEKHYGQNILIIGQYIDQLNQIQKIFGFPLITGSTQNSVREKLYSQFKNNEIKVLIVSKVANYALDLPDASVAIQVSGTFGSRQEEAQRLGRLLRPKTDPCFFYSLTTQYSVEEEFSEKRRKFLVEQGYKYSVIEA